MNNEAMVKRWCPDVDGYDKKQYQKTGDGHIMAIDAGAKMENLGHTKMMHDFDSGLMYEEPFLYVNMEGKRFCNEDTGFVYMGNITKYLPRYNGANVDANHPDGSLGWYCQVYDSDYMSYANSPVPEQVMTKYIPGAVENPQGVFTNLIDTYKADTIEELAALLDVPADELQKTIDRYNELCDQGTDADLQPYQHRSYLGFPESPCPWSQVEHRKFLCPAPGYDRHFKITEEFGFELITIPMTPDGPDMDMVEKLVAEDDTIKGIWCVPQYSNPDGYVYSDETIRRFASMKTAAPDFKIFWDEAYIVHHLTDEIIETPVLLNESKQYGTEDRVFMFTSTSKITFPGAGVSALACSEKSLAYICRRFSVMIISYDKMNQLRHVRFLKNKDGVLQHMAKHRRRLVPCFDAVKTTFAHELTPCGDIAHWTNPKGGYFISLYVMPGCAKRVAQLCKDCGLTLTGAGAAFPYGIDPQDSHLRIAPTYPSLSEVETASMLLTVCVRLAVVEKLLAE